MPNLKDLLAMALAAGFTPQDLMLPGPKRGAASSVPAMATGGDTVDYLSTLSPDQRKQMMGQMGMTGTSSQPSGAGPSLLTSPTAIGGNKAIVPLANEAKKGAAAGSEVPSWQYFQALASLPGFVQDDFIKNTAKLGLHLAKQGTSTVGSPSSPSKPSGIAGEAGPEVEMDAKAGGGTGQDPTIAQLLKYVQSGGQMPTFGDGGSTADHPGVSDEDWDRMTDEERQQMLDSLQQNPVQTDPNGHPMSPAKSIQRPAEQLGTDPNGHQMLPPRNVQATTPQQPLSGPGELPQGFTPDAGQSALNSPPTGTLANPQQPATDPTQTPAPAPSVPGAEQTTWQGIQWRVERHPDGSFWRVPVNPPPGAAAAGAAGGYQLDFQSGRDGTYNDYLNEMKPEDVYPGMSPEMARFMMGQGAGTGASAIGAPAPTNAQPPKERDFAAEARGEFPAPYITQQPSQQPVQSGAGSSTGQAPQVDQTVPGTGSPGGTPTAPSGGNTGTTAGQAQAGTGVGAGTATGTQTDRTGDTGVPDETVSVNGVAIPLVVARGLIADINAGYTPSKAADDNRIKNVASGDLTATRVNKQNLAALPLPQPNKEGMSNIDGNTYKWTRDDNGVWTWYRQASGDEKQGAYLGSLGQVSLGKDAGYDTNKTDWVKGASTSDVNEVRQMNAELMGGSDPAIESNPDFNQTRGSLTDDKGALDINGLRQEMELDPALRQQVEAAVTYYDSPEAMQQRVRDKAAKNPAFQRQLASELIGTGDLPAPTPEQTAQETKPLDVKSTFMEQRGGQWQFRQGISVEPITPGSTLPAIITLDDGRQYLTEDGVTALLLGPDGKPLDAPAEPVAGQEPAAPDQTSAPDQPAANPNAGRIFGDQTPIPDEGWQEGDTYISDDGTVYMYQNGAWVKTQEASGQPLS